MKEKLAELAQRARAAFCRFPRPGDHARMFLLAFGITFGAVLLVLAGFGLYRAGYDASLRENGTYDDGYAAAVSEKGTFQEGYDAAIAEKGTYDDGYKAGYAAGRQEGYDEGHSAGYDEGMGEGFSSGYDSGTSAATSNESAHTRVWVSRIFGSTCHSTPSCGWLIRPREMTLGEALEQGYEKCDRCW